MSGWFRVSLGWFKVNLRLCRVGLGFIWGYLELS